MVRPRIATEKGQHTLTARWYAITGDTDLERARQLTAELAADDAATAEIATWATHTLPDTPGRTFCLPVDRTDDTHRWSGAAHWCRAAEHTLTRLTHNRLKRVARAHWHWILTALASYADRSTGRSVTAANHTIGRKAAELCAAHLQDGGTWTAKGVTPTHRLKPATLAAAVSALVSALTDAGWLVERARGRHLTGLERVSTLLRKGIWQTRTASVRDLIVPDHARPTPPRPTRPGWADPHNPFMLRKGARHLLVSGVTLGLFPTHRHVVTLTSTLTLLGGYLTRARARASHPTPPKPTQKHRSAPPSLAAQRLAAALTSPQGGFGWLLRRPGGGQRVHGHALARIIDATDCAYLTVTDIRTEIDAFLTARHWEFHPTTITAPLSWFSHVLRRIRQSQDSARPETASTVHTPVSAPAHRPSKISNLTHNHQDAPTTRGALCPPPPPRPPRFHFTHDTERSA